MDKQMKDKWERGGVSSSPNPWRTQYESTAGLGCVALRRKPPHPDPSRGCSETHSALFPALHQILAHLSLSGPLMEPGHKREQLG